ncbi:MAG TPA: outer membrane beta-barrel protein, partial [Chitinophagaceae bacterium]|nr:outer membrane beta-barrel protein [Chitinophagaceae bacterium]
STSELKDVKLDYLSIPILLSYRPSKLISFQAGPQFGILLNQDKNLVQNGGEAFKNGDLSLLGGVQLNIGGIRLGGRYAVGLNNINDISNQDEWKNQGFQLYAGFRIL